MSGLCDFFFAAMVPVERSSASGSGASGAVPASGAGAASGSGGMACVVSKSSRIAPYAGLPAGC